MFTGIVEGVGKVLSARHGDGSLSLLVHLADLAQDLKVGDSVSVQGCCLTAESREEGAVRFHLMGETLSRSAFGRTREGDRLNLERALRVGDRLGGHFVSGHLDGVGVVVDRRDDPGQTDLTVEVPEELSSLTIPKGSIALDGVSLTIARIEGRRVTVCLIPHTLANTTLGETRIGQTVHLEMDSIGKWVQRLLIVP